MKHRTRLLILALLATAPALAQTPLSGKISYEGMRQIDRSQMRMVINGQEVRPGSPGAPEPPEGMPEVISFSQKLVFAGGMAKEERDQPQNMVRRTIGDGAGDGGRPPRAVGTRPPFEQTTFLDLTNRQRIEVMTITTDSVSATYRAERPIPKNDSWKDGGKTKKIAGYLCRKATATARSRRMGGGRPDGNSPAGASSGASDPGETYTVWYTTDLPFTYSPVAGLTPEKGVVLQIESDRESFKATSVSLEAVAESAVQPPEDAKAVTPEEMNELRRKTMANFRQKMMTTMPFPGSGRN